MTKKIAHTLWTSKNENRSSLPQGVVVKASSAGSVKKAFSHSPDSKSIRPYQSQFQETDLAKLIA